MDEEKIQTLANEEDKPLTKSGFTHFIENLKDVLGKYITKSGADLEDGAHIGLVDISSDAVCVLSPADISFFYGGGSTTYIMADYIDLFSVSGGQSYISNGIFFLSSVDGSASLEIDVNTDGTVLIQGLTEPKEDSHAANKKYVDNKYVSLQINLTEHELNAIAQGQAMTDLELMILEGK